MIRRPLTIVLAVAASCAVLAAQGTGTPPPQTPPQQQPTFRARVDSVKVDATVLDRDGKPITDLKIEDFEIKESGKVQVIESFEFVKVREDEPIGPELERPILSMSEMLRETANPENRLILIFLDDYHTRTGNALHIKETLARFVEGLSVRDLVALMYPLTAASAVTFSRDHDGTANAIRRFQGRKYNYQPTTQYEQNFAQLPPEQQEQIRNDIVIRSLQSACALLATLRDGRKSLLFVSEGLAANIPPGALTNSTNYAPRTLTTAENDMMNSAAFFRTTDLQARQRDLFTTASRGNTSIYPLDPRGLTPTEFGAGDAVGQAADRLALNEAIDSLRVLADQTDGRAIVGKNDPLPDLNKMVRELGAYYLLGYTSSLAPRDGKFHEIEVKVNRRDVDVRARKGYWAYSEEEIRRASAPPRAGPPEEVAVALDELAAVVEPTSRRGIAVWMGAVRGETERAQVTLVWEAAPTVAQDQIEKVEQISVTATSGGGEVVFKGPVPREPAAAKPSGRVTFAAPAGPLRVRIISENAKGQRLDTEDVNEIVPDFTKVGATITAPQVFRGRTQFELAAVRKSTTAVPVAVRQFSRTERLLLRFEAYGPAGLPPDVTLRLLNKAGEQVSATLPAPKPTTGSTFEVEMGLSNFAMGDYLIEIAAGIGSERSTRLLGIRVTG